MKLAALSASLIFYITWNLYNIASATDCTDLCDSTYQTGLKVEFCGTDYNTYTTNYDAIDSHCYYDCNVMTLYAGKCGCPNDCHSSYGYGKCDGDSSTCQCTENWGGLDCGQPIGANPCSYHGKIRSTDSSKSHFPFEYCECDDGFTGVDCSTHANTIGDAPWGDVTDVKEYHGDDYDDDHPIFDISIIATVRVTMSDADYLSQLYPWDLYNATYVNATMYFDNGQVQEIMDNVGIRIKGAGSRMDMKHGWKIKFDEYISSQSFYDMDSLEFKPGSEPDDCLIKNMIYTNFQRSMGVPTPRGSYALVYFNEVYAGLYFMKESVDDIFIKSRYKDDDGKGNLYKMCRAVHLNYYGDNVTYYQEDHDTFDSGDYWYSYEQTSGDSDWNDLVDVLRFGNATNEDDFEAHLYDNLDVDMVLRQLVIESFMMADDGYVDGQNYHFYHSNNKDTSQPFSLFVFDFDTGLSYDSGLSEDIFDFITRPTVDDEYYNTFNNRILAIQQYNASYVDYYQQFLYHVFSSDSAQQPVDRYSTIMQFVSPWVDKDKLLSVSKGITVDDFQLAAETTIETMQSRYQSTWAQVMSYVDTRVTKK